MLMSFWCWWVFEVCVCMLVCHTKAKSTSTLHIAQSMITVRINVTLFVKIWTPFKYYICFFLSWCWYLCSRRATMNCHTILQKGHLYIYKIYALSNGALIYICMHLFLSTSPLCVFFPILNFIFIRDQNCVKLDISQATFHLSMHSIQWKSRNKRARAMTKQMAKRKKEKYLMKKKVVAHVKKCLVFGSKRKWLVPLPHKFPCE